MAANDLKRGMLIEQDGGSRLLEVQEAFHSSGQARQGGFVSVECRCVTVTLMWHTMVLAHTITTNNHLIDCRDVFTGAKSKMKLATSKTVEVRFMPARNLPFLFSRCKVQCIQQL
jgi:translation elongation factor P/translation initiation factor 5A